VALAALVAGPAAAHAQDYWIELESYRVVEGNGLSLPIKIKRNPAGPIADVYWKTVNGSATGGSDFVSVSSGFVQFSSPDTEKTITVTILGDGTPEPNTATTLPDEFFFVELTSVTPGGTFSRSRATVVIVDDDRSMPGVQFLSVVSGGSSTQGNNKLQWRVPAGQPAAPNQVEIRANAGASSCAFPNLVTDGTLVANIGAASPGLTQGYSHVVATPHQVWCYSVFTIYSGTPTAEVAKVKAKTFDAGAGPIKWTYTSSSTLPNVAPPTIGQDGIYTVDNDGVLHAMQRFGAPGTWPTIWNPAMLNGATSNRSVVVPLSTLGTRLFIGTQNGWVHSVDGRTGTIEWSRQLMAGSTGTQATPGLLLKGYGGANDLVLVGTATGTSNTKFFALDPLTGATFDDYPNGTTDTPPGAVENVFGQPVVDYANNRVYFGTTGVNPTGFTLWSLDLGSPAPDLTLSTTLAWNPKPLGSLVGSNGSLVSRNGWLYLGTGGGGATEGDLNAVRISDGALRIYNHGDGQLKGFPWPDRRNGRLYFSTTNKVHAAFFDGSTLGPDPGWQANLSGVSHVTVSHPSIVLQRPGTDELYVGDDQGHLLRFNAATGAQMGVVTLDGPGTIIGAPSLDTGQTPLPLLLVGSDKGVVYAVQVGF
jgi:hypothetical protein